MRDRETPWDASLRARWFRLFLRLAYEVWRRELSRFLRSRPTRRAARLLDCGCGPGFLLQFCEQWFPGIRLVGVDLDRKALAEARRVTNRTVLVRASLSGPTLPVADGTCDVIFALQVVEHLEEPHAFLHEARRVLAPGGLLVFTTPNPNGLGARLMGGRWTGYRRDHVSLRAPEAWRSALQTARFRLRRDGTTGLTGIPVFHHTPLALLSWIPLFLWGFFPWKQGEAYVCLATPE